MNTLSAAPVVLQGGVAGEAAAIGPVEIAGRPAARRSAAEVWRSIAAKLDAEELSLLSQCARPAWLERQLRAEPRDRALRALAAGLDMRPTAVAEHIETELGRYAATGWRHEREFSQSPSNDPRRQLLHQVLYHNDGAPLKWRRIYDIVCA